MEAHARDTAFRAMASAAPLVLDLEVTRRCNLRCAACYVRAREPGRTLDHAAELPLHLIEEVLDEAAGHLTTLHLTGGEPFAHPRIWDVLDASRRRGLDRVVINTNAVLLARGGGLERLAATGLHVQLLVSVDGPPGAHDGHRGPGVEAAALDVLRRAPGLGVEALAASILTRELVAYGLAPWRDWLAERIGREPALVLWPLFLRPDEPTPAGAVGTPLEPAGEREAAAQLAALLLGGADATLVDGPWLNPLLLELGVPAEKLKPCDAARGRLCVQADGVVSPCHPFALELGRLEPGRVGGFVGRALAHPSAVRLAAHGADGCADCAHREVCGGCQGTVVARGLPLFANDRRCR
jgi:radical SAM protein with 4Fe4S-binding SPASM domain